MTELITAEKLFNNPKSLNIKMIYPDELLILEYKREELSSGGLLLIGVTANIFGQSHRIPKHKVIAIGSEVKEQLGIDIGDLIVIHPKAGKQYFIMSNLECRKIKTSDVLAKIIYEPRDFFQSKPLDPKFKWTKI